MLARLLIALGIGFWALAIAKTKKIPTSEKPVQKITGRDHLSLLEPSTRSFALGLLEWCKEQKIPARVTSTYRTLKEQARHIEAGRSAVKRGQYGWHSVGRAFHLDIRSPDGTFNRDAYKLVGQETRLRGGVWLGDKVIKTPKGSFLDLTHFEYHPGWKTLNAYRGTTLAQKEFSEAQNRASKYV